jgi:signal transduction histidine kinase
MIDRVAERNPQYAGSLHAISGAAARLRTEAAACGHDSGAAGRAGGQLLPGLRNGADALVVSGMEAYLRDMAIVQERDRVAGELRDKVIKRVFAAGLTLDGAVGLTMQPEVRQRIEAAVAEMDDVIRVIRDAVFDLPGPSASHEPDGG